MIGIIFIGDLYVCPYLHRYTTILDTEKVDYEVLFWNRCGDVLNLPKNYKYFDYSSAENQPLRRKAFDFYKYRRWLIDSIKKAKYERIILLSTLSGMIISDKLHRYKGKYIFDVRDYSYENHRVFYAIEKNVIQNSSFSCISSPGFKEFLPDYPYLTMHNMDYNEVCSQYSFEQKPYGSTLNLVWNGTIRYFEHQKKIINKLANDSRFRIIFHGDGPDLCSFKRFVEDKRITNVLFTGRYDNSRKRALLADADILNNSYWIDKVNEVQYALSNRYYDGLIYKIPQLVESGTYKTMLCETNGVGIGLDSHSESFADTLYEWYYSLKAEDFDKNCTDLLNSAISDNKLVEEKIRSFIVQ